MVPMQRRTRAADPPVTDSIRASEAARTLGVSIKALRVYERAGLIRTRRSPGGWRLYGPRALDDARRVIALRTIGVGLADIAALRDADPSERRRLLRAHQAKLESRAAAVADAVAHADRVDETREADALTAIGSASLPESLRTVTLKLPWPWAGEEWALSGLGPLNYITGPLGSGKTRLAMCIAQAIPDAAFVGLDRLADGASAARLRLTTDASLASRVEQAMAALVGDGATAGAALQALLVALCGAPPRVTVIDMVEQDLDDATQRAFMRHLRGRSGEPLLLMTRSTAILDLHKAKASERIVYCPANHSVPLLLYPRQGGVGVEAVDTCLASPAVRARTAGVIACQSVPSRIGR